MGKETPSLVQEFLRIEKELIDELGDRTVFFMQIGSFYSRYAISSTEDESGYDFMCKITECTGLQLTYMDRDNYEYRGTIKNPHMCGFQCGSFEKHVSLLLNNDYTVVLYNQRKGDPSIREFFKKFTPLTSDGAIYKEGVNNTNQIMSIYIEIISESKKMEKVKLSVGISNIDLITGKNEIREISSDNDDYRYVINELYRILSSNKPRELQIYINTTGKNIDKEAFEDYLMSNLELKCYPQLKISFTIKKDYLLRSYQEAFLNLVFGKNIPTCDITPQLKIYLDRGGVIDIFTRLEIEMLQYGTISYILMIIYCKSYNTTLFSKIKRPNVMINEHDNRLLLENNSIIQLNIVQSNISKINYRTKKGRNFSTLLDVVGNCITTMGKRAIRNKILSPSTNSKSIREKHNIIEYLRDQKDFRDKCTYQLKQLYDVEKLNFKLLRGNITPKELSNLYYSYTMIVELINLTVQHVYDTSKKSYLPIYNIFPNKDDLMALNSCVMDMYETFDMKILEKSNIIDGSLNCTTSPVNSVKYKNFHEDNEIIKYCVDRLDTICDQIKSIVGGSQEIDIGSVSKKKIKSKNAEEDEDEEIINTKDLGIYLTDANRKKLMANLHRLDKNLVGDIEFESKNKKYRVKSLIIDDLCEKILHHRNKIALVLYTFYNSYIEYLINKYDMSKIIKFVIDMDLGITNAITSIKYNYYKPTIIDDNKKFVFMGKNVRNPIVERIIKSEYISNDINLNVENTGLVIYGCNSTGKTTCTEAVALNTIMSHAEMWTASELSHSICDRIYTRLSGNDDKEKGHSSFTVEMLEMRSFLKNATSRSLVVGDELCRGTESLSGSSLTIAALEELCNRKSAFIFSSHLHNIPSQKIIIDLIDNKKLKICHLESFCDSMTQDIILNRKILPGPGESVYGLEYAKSLDIDINFIHRAEDIRKEITGEVSGPLSTQKSRYNNEYYKKPCIVCENYDLDKNETHHIKEQSTADENGYIGNMHKNTHSNLISLCNVHHDEVHSGNISISVDITVRGIRYKITRK